MRKVKISVFVDGEVHKRLKLAGVHSGQSIQKIAESLLENYVGPLPRTEQEGEIETEIYTLKMALTALAEKRPNIFDTILTLIKTLRTFIQDQSE